LGTRRPTRHLKWVVPRGALRLRGFLFFGLPVMSRRKNKKDSPERWKVMTLEALRGELQYWRDRIAQVGNPNAREGAVRHVREIEREIELRQASK